MSKSFILCKKLLPITLAIAFLLFPLRWIVAFLFATAVHELGHILAVRLLGGRINKFTVHCHGVLLETQLSARWKAVLAILSGPVAGGMLVLLGRLMPRVAVFAFLQTAFNLLPIYPLDGGRLIGCLGINKHTQYVIEYLTILLILIASVYVGFVMKLGFMPLLAALVMTYRVIMEKSLAKRRVFEYNKLYYKK